MLDVKHFTACFFYGNRAKQTDFQAKHLDYNTNAVTALHRIQCENWAKKLIDL